MAIISELKRNKAVVGFDLGQNWVLFYVLYKIKFIIGPFRLPTSLSVPVLSISSKQ